jgi:hypothetical protein
MVLTGWFRSKSECPIDAATRDWVDTRWQWLEAQFGAERVHKALVVLPRPEFFPDPYHKTEDDARRLLDRVCGYMGLDPGRVELSLYDDQSPPAGLPSYEGKWQGTAGLYHPESGRRGYLTMPVVGYALARFAWSRGENGAGWSRELRPDVRAAFKQGMRFLSAQAIGLRGRSAEPSAAAERGCSVSRHVTYRDVICYTLDIHKCCQHDHEN